MSSVVGEGKTSGYGKLPQNKYSTKRASHTSEYGSAGSRSYSVDEENSSMQSGIESNARSKFLTRNIKTLIALTARNQGSLAVDKPKASINAETDSVMPKKEVRFAVPSSENINNFKKPSKRRMKNPFSASMLRYI